MRVHLPIPLIPSLGGRGLTRNYSVSYKGMGLPPCGGGLCQVSSTFYRAALWGGFEIVDRKPHSYAVSYYAQVGGWGLDATVYPPAVDFVFRK